MSRPLELGEEVLILSDGDVPNELLPLAGRVFYIDQEEYEVWITNIPENPDLDCVLPDEDDDSFVLNFSGYILNQTDYGRTLVIRYSEKDNLGTEHLKGIAKFLRKLELEAKDSLEENKHATV